MNNEYQNFSGFDKQFFSDQGHSDIKLPQLSKKFKDEVDYDESGSIVVLPYINYSLVLSNIRKLPIFVAANIDGKQFLKADRASSWKKDNRSLLSQWGQELYTAIPGFLDRGHMAKREDVQWGANKNAAQVASDSTFFYSNAVPQHKDLNRKIWKRLENYILHKETTTKNLRICVFTGPILIESDLPFAQLIEKKEVLIPSFFWKVVFYQKADGKLYRVGFLISQRQLLIRDKLVIEPELELAEDDDLFMRFSDAETYQVNISLIEQLSGLLFQEAIDSYTDDREVKLILNEVEIDADLEIFSSDNQENYEIENLIL